MITKDELKGALRSKTMLFNGAAFAALGVAPALLENTAFMQGIIAMLPAHWQGLALALVPLVNMYLRKKTTESLADKAGEKLL